jgi:DNA-binding CsgD family transcriptional regulator/N-acetylneuraminic acid mutarotase
MVEAPEALSEREMEVLRLVATGATNQEIARSLVISPNTVKVHLRNIFEKLGVQSRTEATMEAVHRGWVLVAGAAAAQEAVAPGLAEPAAPPKRARQPVESWQRFYMVAAAVLALAALIVPIWWQGRAGVPQATLFTDLGQPESAPVLRPEVARWTELAALPEARSRLAVVADESRIYAIGGENAAGVTGEVAVYDPASNGWLPGSSKPTPVSNVSAAVLDGRFYVPGGTTSAGGVTNVLEVYDPAANAWDVRSPLPVSVTGYALAALQGKMVLFGGWDGANYRGETWVYDPESDQWSQASAMPTARAFGAASALGDVIYVVGGRNGQGELDTVEVYDPAGEDGPEGPWTGRPPMSEARSGLGLAAIGSNLYAVGGGWATPLAFNEQYNARTSAWSRFDTPVAGQWRNLGLVAHNQKLYAIGGWGGSYLSLNEGYQAFLRLLLPLGTKG